MFECSPHSMDVQAIPTTTDSSPPEGPTSSTFTPSFLPTEEADELEEEEEERRLNLTGSTVVTTASNYASDMPYFQSFHSLQMGHDDISDWLDFSTEVPSSAHEPVLSPPSSLLHDLTMPQSAAKVDSEGQVAVSSEWLPSAHPCHTMVQETIASTSLIPMVALECESETVVEGDSDLPVKWTGSVKGSCAFTRDTGINLTLDGYKWRKYGKKTLKRSSYERNYYTCSNKKCSARKYVDCSIDSKFTLTSYEGTHNHPSNVSSPLH